MRPLALIGLVGAVLLAGIATFNTDESVSGRRAAQDRALQGALSSELGRVSGSVHQMSTGASQMLVNPAVHELLSGPPLSPAARRTDVAEATAALDAFRRSAIVPTSTACVQTAAGAQLACASGINPASFGTTLGRTMAAIAGRSRLPVTTSVFRSPVDGAPTFSYLVPLRAGPRLLGLVHFDILSTTVLGSSVIVTDIPGVELKLASYESGRLILPGPWANTKLGTAPAMRAGAGGSSLERRPWAGLLGGHRAMVVELPLAIVDQRRAGAVLARQTSPNPDYLNAWSPWMLAVLALALLVLAASVAALLSANRRIVHELSTDPLTGLRNRRALTEELPRVCARASDEAPAFLWFFDLDGFKNYNDAFGHLAGDALLTRLGQRLRDTVSPFGSAFRLGGDEFCALLVAPLADPHALFQRARHSLSEKGRAFTVTASAGAVEIPRETSDPTQAMRLADHHMYRDKTASRGGAAELVTAVLHAALAQRHPELDEHSSDVACDVELLARAIGLDEEAVGLIIRAGDLHDVGKLGIPDEIIKRPGALSESEWEFMRQHTVMGERIIAAAGPSMEPIAPLVRASHERWDGQGYPDGLAGDAIPLGARIITICDSFRAMLSVRPYKQALTLEDAVQELRRCAGTQFDPHLVDVFCTIIERRPAPEQLRASDQR